MFFTCDFNGHSQLWWQDGDSNNDSEAIEDLTSLLGLRQLISEPTNIQTNNNKSCIDLIFTDQPNMITNSGVHPSLHPNCHHQIIFCHLRLKIYYPTPNERVMQSYKNANATLISRAIHEFYWENLFFVKNVHGKLNLFNNIVMNIFKNYIPNKIITCNDKDLLWINDEVKNLIKLQKVILNNYIKNGRKSEDHNLLSLWAKPCSKSVKKNIKMMSKVMKKQLWA